MDVKTILETFGLPVLVGISSYFVGKRKTNTDIRKTEAEIEKIEIDKRFEEIGLFEKINKILSEQNR